MHVHGMVLSYAQGKLYFYLTCERSILSSYSLLSAHLYSSASRHLSCPHFRIDTDTN